MKIFLTAIAMMIAVPATAQTAPAADPHAGHKMPMDHSQHGQSGHGAGHGGHMKCCEQADGKKADCCDKVKADGTKMDCCEKHAGKGGADQHASHDMSKH